MFRTQSARISLTLAAASIAAAAACGSKTQEAPAPDAAAAPKPAVAATPIPMADSFGNVKVNTKPPTGDAGNASPGISILEILAKNPSPQTVIATVNGEPIRRAQVDAAYHLYLRTLRARGQTLSAEDDANLKATSFRMVVADELLNQAAIQAGIKVTPAEVDKALADARSRLGTPAEWAQFVKESQLTEAGLRAQVERNIRTDAYRRSLTANRPVTEQQAKEFYERNRNSFMVPESVHALLILLPATEQAAPAEREEARRLAEEARTKAAAGEDFGALARQYSQDPSAQRGGDIGFVPRGVMFPNAEQVAFGLKVGEVSSVIETPKGYTVFKVVDRKPESIPTFDEIKQGLMADMGRMMGRNALEAKVQELSSAAEVVVVDPRDVGTASAAK